LAARNSGHAFCFAISGGKAEAATYDVIVQVHLIIVGDAAGAGVFVASRKLLSVDRPNSLGHETIPNAMTKGVLASQKGPGQSASSSRCKCVVTGCVDCECVEGMSGDDTVFTIGCWIKRRP